MTMEDAQVKYTRPDFSWNQLPFQANSAGIALYITALTTLISATKLQSSLVCIVPVIGYLLGLFLSYITHMLHVSLLLDHDQRERLNSTMEFALAKDRQPDLPYAERQKIQNLLEFVVSERGKVLSPEKVKKFMVRATLSYSAAMFLFLCSTIFITAQFAFFLLS